MLDYNYFKDFYKTIAIDLSKQQAFDADPKAMQQVNFTENSKKEGDKNAPMLFIIEKGEETVLDFSQATVKVF